MRNNKTYNVGLFLPFNRNKKKNVIRERISTILHAPYRVEEIKKKRISKQINNPSVIWISTRMLTRLYVKPSYHFGFERDDKIVYIGKNWTRVITVRYH